MEKGVPLALLIAVNSKNKSEEKRQRVELDVIPKEKLIRILRHIS